MFSVFLRFSRFVFLRYRYNHSGLFFISISTEWLFTQSKWKAQKSYATFCASSRALAFSILFLRACDLMDKMFPPQWRLISSRSLKLFFADSTSLVKLGLSSLKNTNWLKKLRENLWWKTTYALTVDRAKQLTVFRRTTLPRRALPLTMQYGMFIFRHRAGRKRTTWSRTLLRWTKRNVPVAHFNGIDVVGDDNKLSFLLLNQLGDSVDSRARNKRLMPATKPKYFPSYRTTAGRLEGAALPPFPVAFLAACSRRRSLCWRLLSGRYLLRSLKTDCAETRHSEMLYSPKSRILLCPHLQSLPVGLSNARLNWLIGGGTFKRWYKILRCRWILTYRGHFTKRVRSRLGWISWPTISYWNDGIKSSRKTKEKHKADTAFSSVKQTPYRFRNSWAAFRREDLLRPSVFRSSSW